MAEVPLAGFGSAKGSNEEAYLFQKLIRQGFGTNNVDHCTRLCHASSVAALMEGLNSGAVTAPFTAAMDAECIIVIGARPAENHPVAATFLKNAVDRGKTLILMDPRGHAQGLAPHAAHVLQFKPGTDVALLNAMLHTIVEEELYDQQYIQANTEGFAELKERIKAFPPEEMAQVCGIEAATIREVARIYAGSSASIVFWGNGHRAACARHRQRPLPDRAGRSQRAKSAGRARGCIRYAARTMSKARRIRA